MEMIEEHLMKPTTVNRRETAHEVYWSPLPAGTLQVNVDAALFSSSRRMGAGVVVRDHNDAFVAACGDIYPEVTVPELVEAMAIRLALSFSKDEGLHGLIVATDCLSVVQRIQNVERDRSTVGSVIVDIKKMSAEFRSFKFIHVRRGQNADAHVLARSCESISNSVWRGVSPNLIRETICIDSMFV